MNLIISSQDGKLDGPVDQRFGRSAWLVKVDSETGEWQVFPNPGVSQSGGAGIAAAQFVVDQKAGTVISGDFGPNAANAFRAAGVEMRLFSGDISTVQQAVDAFKKGSLLVFP